MKADTDWWFSAVCAQTDPDLFFPDQVPTKASKATCLGCEVRPECLEYALAHDERFGVWGGLDITERQKLTKGAS